MAGEGIGFGTTYIPGRSVAKDQDHDHYGGTVNRATLQHVADLPKSTLTHQDSPILVINEAAPSSATCNYLDVTKEAEDDGFDALLDIPGIGVE